MAGKVSRSDVTAFRLNAHNLTERLGRKGLLEAAGRCGVQNSPPGSALLALHARVKNLSQDDVGKAIADDRSLLQTWCMRGSPFFLPTADAPVFTTGVLPPTEKALSHFIAGVEQVLDKLDMTITDAVDLTAGEIDKVLSGRQLAINELGAELAGRVGRKLSKKRRELWEGKGPWGADQPLGEGVVHFCVRVLTLRKQVCFAPRDGNKAPFVLVDEWLGHPVPDVEPGVARAELLRRYLRCYGPSTRGDFAAWVGLQAGDTDPWWSPIEEELTPVDFGGKAWILTEDADDLRSAPHAEGVRLLPPGDPYTQMRDRETIVEKKYQREVWKNVGQPGVVLAHGRITGTWRPRRNGKRLTMTIRTFDTLASRDRKPLEAEAEAVASLRGASSVEVGFETC
ncbi:winged helix DNA-binding domain-containing protein [Kibdelosporangium lantanae]